LVDLIYLRLGDRGPVESCYLLDRHAAYRGSDWYDILDYLALKKQQRAMTVSRQLQASAAYDAQIERVTQAAQEQQAKVLMDEKPSKAVRLRAIRENRQLEKEMERENNAWRLASTETDSGSKQVPPPSPRLTDGAVYVPNPQNIDLLRKMRQKKLAGRVDHEA
jgi:hypothetical protein